MLSIIRERFPENTWIENISSDDRLKDAEKVFQDLKNKNREIDLVDCLHFCDKKEIISKKRRHPKKNKI